MMAVSARRSNIRRTLVGVAALAVLAGCADSGTASSASSGGGGPTSAPAPSPPPEPEPTRSEIDGLVTATARISQTQEFEDTLGLGRDFNEIFILFGLRLTNVGSTPVVGVEGHLRLLNSFGDETARIGFTKTETIAPGASLVDNDSGLNFKRYECDMRRGEWCRALDADFANYRIEAVVDRVALQGGEVINR